MIQPKEHQCDIMDSAVQIMLRFLCMSIMLSSWNVTPKAPVNFILGQTMESVVRGHGLLQSQMLICMEEQKYYL